MRPLASIALLVVAGCGLSLQGEGLGTDQDAEPASGDGGGADSTGTGGSSGAEYLRGAADSHYVFKELAELTSFLLPRHLLPALPEAVVKGLSYTNS